MSDILLVNSEKISDEFLNIFRGLEKRGLSFYVLSDQENILSLVQDPDKKGKKIFLGPSLSGKLSVLFFAFLLPPLFLRRAIELYFLKKKKHIGKIVCTNWNEKIIYTPLAKLFKLPMIWIELPSVDYNKPKFLLRLYKACCGNTPIITFLSADKFKLAGICDNIENIRTVNPGVEVGLYEHQDTIFSGMARSTHAEKNNDLFVLGVIDFYHSSQIESLFKAVNKCLGLVSNFKVIIISGNEEKKGLEWLARKMEIQELVWLVGNQRDWKKWIESFNIFLAFSDRPSFFDLEMAMAAMIKRVPVIALKIKGYEELIEESRTGALVEPNNSEILAQKLIKLYQDKQLRSEIAENSRNLVLNNYNRQKQLDKLQQLIAGSAD